MACCFRATRITLSGGYSSLRGLPLSSFASQTRCNRLRLPIHARHKSSNAVASNEGKWYTFMTKSRTGIGSFASICGHASSICTVFAYCNTDMLELRYLAVSSGILSITFQYFRPQPLWIPIKWNCLLLFINGCMITQLLLERHRANRMPPELLKIYEEGSFDERGFSKVQFVKFFKYARRTVFVENDLISQEGREMNKLYYILDGKATVTCRKGRRLATISPHHFIGELSYMLYVQDNKNRKQQQKPLQKVMASADVNAGEKAIHVMEWDFDKLLEIMEDDRDLSNAFAVYSSHDLRKKLLATNADADRVDSHKIETKNVEASK